MNTIETLANKFKSMNTYPIWYYKELLPVEVDYVVLNLLKESFVVEIDGCKHEITFGKNRKQEIVQCIDYKDIKSSHLTSYDVVLKGFREGNWYTISETDTTEDFKAKYIKRKTEYERQELDRLYRDVLINIIKSAKKIPEEDKNKHYKSIEDYSFEDIEYIIKELFCKFDNSKKNEDNET